MWEWIKRLFGPEPEAPSAPQMVAQPIILNASEEHAISHARYRLDAIRRYNEQTAKISVKKRREFLVESIAHAELLFRAGKIDEPEHDRLINAALDQRTGD